ncbi:MAG TPA: hypothetical protein VGP47_08960 [Parachlamydiaceae bacterium]|nr:hypothetical protein [Parachlamydiaceae bacterium]
MPSPVGRNPVKPVKTASPALQQPAIQRGNQNLPQQRGANQRVKSSGAPRQTRSQADFKTQARQQLNQSNRARTRPAAQGNLLQQNFRNSYSNLRQSNSKHANHVRDNLRNRRPTYNNYFNDYFFNRYDYQPTWYTSGYDTWGESNWNNINSWVDSGWSTPLYYDDVGVVTEVPVEYVTGVSVLPSTQGNWLPLGVFAASQNVQDAAFTNMFVQIVVDKTGILSGTYYNAATDQIHPLDGFLDMESQQAVWRVSDNLNSPVMTAGIYNLTQDIAEVKVRYSNGNEQYWTFVRLTQ